MFYIYPFDNAAFFLKISKRINSLRGKRRPGGANLKSDQRIKKILYQNQI